MSFDKQKENVWNKKSWRSDEYQYVHGPSYQDLEILQIVDENLKRASPLVSVEEINQLLYKLQQVATGNAFLLHCGECAESFINISKEGVSRYLETVEKGAEILQKNLNMPVIKIGRIAGQFAKPRTAKFELQNGISLPIYKGDMINSVDFNYQARLHNPFRLIDAYMKSKIVLEYIKSHHYNAAHTLYTSHEALVLNYEEALTREKNGSFYNASAHFLWIGNRTRFKNSAHLEYVRGISNPLGIKIDASISTAELLSIIDLLNPDGIFGKINIIVRAGANKIKDFLADIMYKIRREGKEVLWSCDPMHGNTKVLSSGKKIRFIEDIASEMQDFFDVAKSEGIDAKGIHLEITADDVEECSTAAITEDKLRSSSYCDPRLNADQFLNLLKLIV